MFGGRQKKSESQQHTRRRFGVAALGADDEDSEIDGGHFYPHGFAKWNVLRQKTWRVISSEKMDWILAVMILSSVVILIIDADLTVKSPRSPEEEVLQAIANYITGAYTCVYAAEMTARLYVFRAEVFKTALLFDFLIVAADVLLLIADLVLEGFAFELGFLRVFRLARLFRFVRVVGMFPELQFLIKGFISSFSAVFWGSILMWIVILMWAIVAVYFIQPVNQEIVAATGSEECERDCRAWSSVWYSVITLCQTVVFGDSWGASAIAIIEKEPLTIIIFIGMYATVTLGVLNLIVAAIVDSGAQAREEAQEAKRRRQRIEEQKHKERQKNRLLEICKILDDDESGSLSFDELLYGFERNADFRNAMKDYNIDQKDLEVLFRVFDEAHTGVLDYENFFSMIDSAREQASQQVLTFVRFAVTDLRQQVLAGQEMLKSELDTIKEFVIDAENSLNERFCRLSGESFPLKKTVASASKALANRGNERTSKSGSSACDRAESRKSRGSVVSMSERVSERMSERAGRSGGSGFSVSDRIERSGGSGLSMSDPVEKSGGSGFSVGDRVERSGGSGLSVGETRSEKESPATLSSLLHLGKESRSSSPKGPRIRIPESGHKEKAASLQQLMKINRELLKGVRKLLLASEIDLSPGMGGRLISPDSEPDMREAAHADSWVRHSRSSQSSLGLMERGPSSPTVAAAPLAGGVRRGSSATPSPAQGLQSRDIREL